MTDDCRKILAEIKTELEAALAKVNAVLKLEESRFDDHSEDKERFIAP